MKKKTFKNILAIFLLVLMLLFVLGIIVHFAGGKAVTPSDKVEGPSSSDTDNNNPSKLPVEDDETVILAINGNVLTSGQYIGLSNGVNKFVVKNAKEYTASVCFAGGKEFFNYSSDGTFGYIYEKDLKKAFDVKLTDSGFTIDIPGDIYSLISRVVGVEDIVYSDSLDFSDSIDFSEMFVLKVRADDVSYEIPFKITTFFNVLLNCERIVLI